MKLLLPMALVLLASCVTPGTVSKSAILSPVRRVLERTEGYASSWTGSTIADLETLTNSREGFDRIASLPAERVSVGMLEGWLPDLLKLHKREVYRDSQLSEAHRQTYTNTGLLLERLMTQIKRE